MATLGPASSAWALHETLLEVLRRLNQAEGRELDVPGLEYAEIERAMRQFWTAQAGEVDLDFTLRLLVENGLVGQLDAPAYSWDRRRLVGERFCITTLGKSYLVRQIEESDRIR